MLQTNFLSFFSSQSSTVGRPPSFSSSLAQTSGVVCGRVREYRTRTVDTSGQQRRANNREKENHIKLLTHVKAE